MSNQWEVYFEFCHQAKPQAKNKFVVVAYASASHCYGFFINSRINAFIASRQQLLSCEVSMYKADYSFLDHDSFIDCRDAYPFRAVDFNNYVGRLHPNTVQDVLKAVSICKVIRQVPKKLILGIL
jgi:hypothetical protein